MKKSLAWPWWMGFFVITAVAGLLTKAAYENGDLLPDTIRNNDKVFHFVIAGLLAFFLDGALQRRMIGRLPLASSGLLVLMATEEFVQRYSRTRTSSISDFAADFAGVVFFTWLSRAISKSSLPDARNDRAE